MHVAVVGAGIVGLTTAWYLSEAGVEVTIIDAGEAGHGASGGNGGQLSYDFVAPMADPSVWFKMPSLLLDSQSPVQIRFRSDLAFLAWMARFLAACNRETAARTTRSLLALARTSRHLATEFFAAHQPPVDYRVAGKLVMYRDATSFAAARQQMALQAALGSEQNALGIDACVGLEPALARDAKHLVGGIWTPTEAVVDTQKLCDVLLEKLVQGRGVQRIRARATHLMVERALVGVRTSQGDVRVDACVVAAGVGSRALMKPAGMKLPIEPLKGYSLSVPIDDAACAPSISITDSANKIVYARLGTRLRIAGMAELLGVDATVERRRVDQLVANAQKLFGRFGDFSKASPWVGFRPATPTGVPIFGATPVKGLFLNTGHGGLGLTLSFATAKAVAQAVTLD